MTKINILLSLLVLIVACGQRKSNQIKDESLSSNVSLDSGYYKVYFENNGVIPGKYKVTEMLYVINPNGARQFSIPDTSSKAVGNYEYGEHIWFIRNLDTTVNGKKDTWVELVERVNKKLQINGVDFSGYIYELIYLRKNDLGSEENLMLSKDEIYEVYDNNYKPSQISKKYFQIQSLSHDEFYKNPPPNDWIRKTYGWTYEAVVKKISLKLNKVDTLLIFNNKPFAAETDFHVFMEEIDRINCYMIFGGYYEAHRFLLYDRDYGECKASLIGYPCISPNNKYIVSFYDNPYGDGGGEFEVYSITSSGPYKLVKSFSFTNWRPFEEPIEFAWINDNEFKIKVYSIFKHFRPWTESEGFPKTGYLKFKIQ